MKRILIIVLVFSFSTSSFSQSEEAQQLLLNVEKLSQLKQILNSLYKGYEIVSKGYNTIKDLSQGNFELHKVFLDKLSEVSPVVKKYRKVGDIISSQLQLVREYKNAYNRFKADHNFNGPEIAYLGKVYSYLFNQSLKNLDDLLMVITANKMKMSDDERLAAIDTLFDDMQDKLTFLRHFNNSTSVLALQRARERHDINTIQNLYGITP